MGRSVTETPLICSILLYWFILWLISHQLVLKFMMTLMAGIFWVELIRSMKVFGTLAGEPKTGGLSTEL